MKKKFFVFLMCSMFVLSLNGCGGEKVSAEDLINNPEAFKTGDKTDMDMDLILSYSIDGEDDSSVRMEVHTNMQADPLHSHMKGNANITIQDMDIKQEQEAYFDYENKKRYDYDSDSKTWTYQTFDSVQEPFSPPSSSMFKNLSLEKKKKDEGYVVTGILDGNMEQMLGGGMDVSSVLGDAGVNEDSIMINARLTFDEETKKITKMELSADKENTGVDEFSVIISFNKVDSSMKIEIPGAVAQNAISMKEFSSIRHADETRMEEIEAEGTEEDVQTGSDTFGSYNGAVFGTGFPLSAYTNDGWVADEKESEGKIYVTFSNDKYEGAVLDLYGISAGTNLELLKNGGIYGYDLKVTYCKEGQTLPAATFNGLTWGASYEDVVAKYGEPEDVYVAEPEKESDAGWTTLYYEAYDGTDVTFRISDGSGGYIKGLSGVCVRNFVIME